MKAEGNQTATSLQSVAWPLECARVSCFLARLQKSAWVSMPNEFRPSSLAATLVVPLPTNGSSTQSPGSVKSLTNHLGRLLGNAALWLLFPHSVARCSTLEGYARSRPTQLRMFFPNPLPTCELKRTTSFFPSDFRRVFAHAPIRTRTASWFILNVRVLLNCRHRSHASRKRLGHLPG